MRLQKINKTLKEFDHFTGGPNDKFAEVALATFYSLTVLGLTPAKTLLDIGCEQVQGYSIAFPMPEDEARDWLAQRMPKGRVLELKRDVVA